MLIDHFHLTIPEIRELTQYQIQELYFHKRDKSGSVVIPIPDIPTGLEIENNLAVLQEMANLGALNGDIAKVKRALEPNSGGV